MKNKATLIQQGETRKAYDDMHAARKAMYGMRAQAKCYPNSRKVAEQLIEYTEKYESAKAKCDAMVSLIKSQYRANQD